MSEYNGKDEIEFHKKRRYKIREYHMTRNDILELPDNHKIIDFETNKVDNFGTKDLELKLIVLIWEESY